MTQAPQEDPNPFASYADRFRDQMHARSEAELNQPLPRWGLRGTLGALAGRVASLLAETSLVMLLVGGLLWLKDLAEGSPSPRLVWAIASATGAMYVGAGLFKRVARLVEDRLPHPMGLFSAWLAAAVGWVALAVAAGLALHLAGLLDGAPRWLGDGWVLLALALWCTLALWSLTRTWRWPVGVAVLAALVVTGLLVVTFGATVYTLTGSTGWWSRLLASSPVVTLPGLLWLAHRPMGMLAVSSRRDRL